MNQIYLTVISASSVTDQMYATVISISSVMD